MVPLVLVGAAFALRLWVLRSIPLIDTDGVIYVTLARQFRASGSPFDSLFHPPYPLCIALLQPLVGDWELAGRLVSAIFGSLLVLPGVVARARQREWLASEGVLLAASLPPFVSLAFHIESRIFFPILPFLLPFAAQGARWVAGAVFEGRRARVSALLVVLAVALALLPYALRPVLRQDPGAALDRQVARWVAESQPPDAVLLDRKPFVAFYSGRRFAPLGRVGPEGLLAAARHAGARLVVLDSRALPYDRPRLVPLVWSAPPLGLEVLRDFDAAPADRIRVLLVRDGG